MKLPKSLLEGHRRFLRDRHAPERGRYIQLAELGQSPTAMVIACCDARADVSTIFDAEPGQLFILRNVALLGIDSVQTGIDRRRSVWELLGGEMKPSGLDSVAHDVTLDGLSDALDMILAGGATGRMVVDVRSG